MSQPLKGKIKRLLADKRYGFIEADVSGTEYFFHRDDFVGHWDDLVDDFAEFPVPVEFHANPASTKGPRAANVRRTDHPNQSV